MKQITRRIGYRLAVLMSVVGVLTACVPYQATALTTNPTASARISFTFDDGLANTLTRAQPILAQHDLKGTVYVATGCVGMITAPNACRANSGEPYMSWAQLQQLQNSYGWEIGSHTVSHRCLASSRMQGGDDCQVAQLTPAQVEAELVDSKNALSVNGINATAFAPPYGDYNNAVLAQVAKYYSSMRGFKEQNNNVWPYNDYLLNNYAPQQAANSVALVQAKIDDAIANGRWLVLTFHSISPTPSTNPNDYQYGTAELEQIAQYVAAKRTAGLIKPVRVSEGLVTSDTNMLANGTFNNGIADGWTTDDLASITADTSNNGSYPDSTKAIKFVSPTARPSSHLFSPKVAVDPRTTHLFKSFLNVQAITTGQLAFYVDEYDASGNWISGQYLKQENSAFVESINFAYKPSTAAVSRASLQVIVAGTGIAAYLDNAQMFALTAATGTNLVANGTFNNGIADGWSTDDPVRIIADAGNHGGPASPQNSIALLAGTGGNTHLFSPRVSVAAGSSYSVSAYLNLAAITSGEIAFYMDEYDAAGNWVSGKYLTGVRAKNIGNVGFVYTPQSANVAAASLQAIVVSNSGISAYFDDVSWYRN